MAWDGMGDFVRALERRGELLRVARRVDPVLEVAAIADRVMKAGGPALLFEDVGGSPFPALVNAFGSRARMALALGVDDVEEHARAIEALLRAPGAGTGAAALAALAPALAGLAHVPPRAAARGACQEVVRTGEDVDLDALPILTTWPRDGGPFVTLPNVITRDPETGARNVGMYRMQKLDRRTTAMHWQVHKTGARHFRRAKELGLRRLEVAVALGGDPALTYAATAPLPDGLDEWMLAGFLRKKAVRTVRCKTVALEVPADADIVLEGYVDPAEELAFEGPFGDHTGYYTPVDRFPRFHVTAMTHRRDAVYPCTLVGPPPMEDAWLGKATERLFLPMLRALFPEIVDMNLPVEGAFHNLVLLSIKKQYPFHAARVAHGLWGAGQMAFSKVICVFDDDVDVQDVGVASWRLLANLDPKRDLAFVEGPIDQLDHGANQALHGSKVCVDATRKWPEEGYRREWPEVCTMPEEVVRRVDARWAELGLAGALAPRPAAPSARVDARAPVARAAARGAPVARVDARALDCAAHDQGVRAMFERIAPTYDRVNRVLSAGVDGAWRRAAVAALARAERPPRRVLDLCAGTLDLAALVARRFPDAEIVAADAAPRMLERGREKARRAAVVVADALDLPFEDGAFDAVVCGFGMRNLSDVARGAREARRVLAPGGRFVTLELFRPTGIGARAFHAGYGRFVLPALGGAVSGDRAAYAYLAESMKGFLAREEYERLLVACGFAQVRGRDLTLGVASIVTAEVA